MPVICFTTKFTRYLFEWFFFLSFILTSPYLPNGVRCYDFLTIFKDSCRIPKGRRIFICKRARYPGPHSLKRKSSIFSLFSLVLPVGLFDFGSRAAREIIPSRRLHTTTITMSCARFSDFLFNAFQSVWFAKTRGHPAITWYFCGQVTRWRPLPFIATFLRMYTRGLCIFLWVNRTVTSHY